MIYQEVVMEISSLFRQGYSKREIARSLGISKNTVKKYLSGEETAFKPRSYKSKLDPFRDYVEERIKSSSPHRLPATVLLREIQDMGYSGRYTILKDFLRQFYPAHKEVFERFETKPGFQMQADFTNVKFKDASFYAFVAELAFSRYSFVKFTADMRLDSFIVAHKEALEYFGGVPSTCLYDNMKTVILSRNYYGNNIHKYNPAFIDFCRHYGIVPRVCRPYRPQTKGKVERFMDYLKRCFFVPHASLLSQGGIDITVESANNLVLNWLENTANKRIHGTTGKRPLDMFETEKIYLTKLPPSGYPVPEAKKLDFLRTIKIAVTDLKPYDFLTGGTYAD
jgi:transposase